MPDTRSQVYARALIFIGFVCLAVLGLDLKQTWNARNERLHEAMIKTGNLTRSLAQHVQDVVETTDALLKVTIQTLDVEGTDPLALQRLNRHLHDRVRDQVLLHGIAVFDENGDWVATSLEGPEFDKVRHANYAGRDYFRYHREHPDDWVLISLPVRSRLDGTWVITVSRRLNRPDGRFAGIVEAAIATDLLQQFFGTFEIGNHGAITLTNRQGMVIVRRPFDEINVGRDVARSEFFQKLQPDADNGSFEFTSLIGPSLRLGSYHRIPGFDLIMIVALDRSEVLAPWWHDTQVHLVWLAITAAVMLLLGHRLALQIRDRVAAESVAQALRLEADLRLGSDAERLSHAQELERQRRELERSNADLEQFAYAASHDLRAPLRAIAHLAQWIGEDVRPTASTETIDNLNLLNGRVARLQMLIAGLLAYARVGRIDREAEDIDIAAAVHDIAAMLAPPPDFVIRCDPDMPVIRTHRAPLALVLKNLISNAQQHHDRAEGHVTVAMRRVDEATAELRVSDDGPGIEPRFQEQIFVIFKTLRSRDDAESAGIGLAMVKRQVTENGGRIWVESAPPTRGTSFVFTWKLAR